MIDYRAKLAKVGEILGTTATWRVDMYPIDYHTPAYRQLVYAEIELPQCEALGYDQILKLAEHLGTTEINFQSAIEHSYYGEVDNIVRLWACWPKAQPSLVDPGIDPAHLEPERDKAYDAPGDRGIDLMRKNY